AHVPPPGIISDKRQALMVSEPSGGVEIVLAELETRGGISIHPVGVLVDIECLVPTRDGRASETGDERGLYVILVLGEGVGMVGQSGLGIRYASRVFNEADALAPHRQINVA